MPTTTTLDGRAREAVGSACEHVRDAGEADHVDGVSVALVASPTSTAEVSEVMRAADAHDLTVVPTGRRTKLTWGRPPASADLLLDLSGLDQVLEHAAGDLIVVTQAGTSLSHLQEVVAEEGQQLAVDETVPGSSVGGTLAAATSGPGRVEAGTMRDLLIGLTVVRADGVVAKAGGRVVEDCQDVLAVVAVEKGRRSSLRCGYQEDLGGALLAAALQPLGKLDYKVVA